MEYPDFFTRDPIENIRALIYLIELDDNKTPSESLFGGRLIRRPPASASDNLNDF